MKKCEFCFAEMNTPYKTVNKKTYCSKTCAIKNGAMPNTFKPIKRYRVHRGMYETSWSKKEGLEGAI